MVDWLEQAMVEVAEGEHVQITSDMRKIIPTLRPLGFFQALRVVGREFVFATNHKETNGATLCR